MNMVVRDISNVPPDKPGKREVIPHVGHSARCDTVSQLCDHVNQMLFYAYGHHDYDVELPGRSNVDERMPLRFLRPCALVLNRLIKEHDLAVEKVEVPGDSIDYHGLIPLVNRISTTINDIHEALP